MSDIKVHEPVTGNYDAIMAGLSKIEGWTLSLMASVLEEGAQPVHNYIMSLNVRGQFIVQPIIVSKTELESLGDLIARVLAGHDETVANLAALVEKGRPT